jgi:hypothetical protein
MIRRGTAGRMRLWPTSRRTSPISPGWRHDLEMLVRLLEMAQMEAQERIQPRGKRGSS